MGGFWRGTSGRYSRAAGACAAVLRGRVAGAEEEFLIFGTIILTLGFGFGLSAALSYFLSKSFGLLRETIAHRS